MYVMSLSQRQALPGDSVVPLSCVCVGGTYGWLHTRIEVGSKEIRDPRTALACPYWVWADFWRVHHWISYL